MGVTHRKYMQREEAYAILRNICAGLPAIYRVSKDRTGDSPVFLRIDL